MSSFAPNAPSPTPSASGESVARILGDAGCWMVVAGVAAITGVLLSLPMTALGMGAPPPFLFIAIFDCAGSLVLLVVARRYLRRMPPSQPAQPLPRMASVCLLLAAAVAGAMISRVFAPALTRSVADLLAVEPAVLAATALFLFVGVVVLAPLAEELFFRDYLWRRLAPHGRGRTAQVTLGIWCSWVLVRLGDPMDALAILPLGLLVTWTRDRTDSPRLGIALHVAWNAVCYLVPIVAALLRG